MYDEFKILDATYLILNTYKAFAVANEQSESSLKYIGIFSYFIGGLSRTIWGFLYDYLKFHKLFLFINISAVIISGTFYFAVENLTVYAVSVVLTNVLHAGIFTIMPSFCLKVFGLK